MIFSYIRRKAAALGIAFLAAVPFGLVVNLVLSKMLGEPSFDVWDLLAVFVLLILAGSSFLCDYAMKRGTAPK